MKALLISILYAAIRRYVGGGVVDRIKAEVEHYSDMDIPGDDKRKHVLESMKAEAKTIGSVAIATALEIVLLHIRGG